MNDQNNNKIICSQADLQKVIKRLAHEIDEKHPDFSELIFIGIQTRGVSLARRMKEAFKAIESYDVPLGTLDITLYRDDLTAIGPRPVVRQTKIDFDITDKKIILIDDVLFTGRTARAALDEIMDFGRPQTIELLVLVDRGHRELPIRPDYVGKNIPTARDQSVEVRLQESDGKDEIVIIN
jgi:pyrimidine operon attenuation protein / uracil phosphoribosyltransferase